MKYNELYRELERTLTAFPDVLAGFAPEQLDVIPFEGSWSPGQVAEHMILANSGFVELLNGPTEGTKRQPDQYIDSIRTIFLDFGTKLKSPDFILPVREVHDQGQQLDALELIRQGILSAVMEKDLSTTCTSFQVPVLGHVTKLEALHFVLYHTQRHIHQLKNIRRALTPA